MGDIDKLKSYSLSDGDIRKLLGSDISIMTYPELKHMKHIDECFDSKGRCIILYLTESENSGHWTALIKRGSDIEFFDPYGEKPDDELKWVSGGKREELGITQPYLTKLLRQSEVPVIYNKVPFQDENDSIETCGRHTASRLLFSHLSLPEYYDMIKKSKLDADDFVAGLTFPLIRK